MVRSLRVVALGLISNKEKQHSALGSQAIKPYRGFQCDESRVLMHELLTDPAQFAHYFERYACSLVSILGWGRRIGSLDDSILKTAVRNSLPFLRLSKTLTRALELTAHVPGQNDA